MTPTRRDQLISQYQNCLLMGDLEKASDIIDLASDDPELIAHIVDVDRQYEESEGIAPSEEDQNRSLRNRPAPLFFV
jgi:hypothetical protein